MLLQAVSDNYIYSFFLALTKQISDKYDLSVRSAFNASRGFYLQLYTSSSDNETPGPPANTISKIEQLPKEFLKVTKHRGTFSFTTLDLIKLNSKNV